MLRSGHGNSLLEFLDLVAQGTALEKSSKGPRLQACAVVSLKEATWSQKTLLPRHNQQRWAPSHITGNLEKCICIYSI